MNRRALFVLALVFALARVGRSYAQSAPQIQVATDDGVVAVGDTLDVQMSASSPDTMPGDPQLKPPAGLVLRGQRASPSQAHISINGARSDRYTLIVDWFLQAQRPGTYTVGPPSVSVGGARYSGSTVTVRVVPPGHAPPRRSRPQAVPSLPSGFSPFDPWRGLFPDLGNNGPEPSPVPLDPRLALDAPRDATYFLHAAIDKPSAVVGEQVTFSVYEYADASANGLEGDEDHDPQVADFVKHSLMRDDQEPPVLGYASVGGRPWRVRLVRQWALFPLHAGDLSIGPMSILLSQPRQRGSAVRRASEDLRVHVTEPPAAGRPAGYALGDVGRFTLRVHVEPTAVEQGGAVGVHVEIAGTGNVPATIAVPAREGVEWLAPEVHDELGPTGKLYGGKRSFDYVVRLKKPGDIDLGPLALPFWDPESRRYSVASANLGTVRVAPSAQAAAQPAESAPEVLPGLPATHDALEGAPSAGRHLDDSPLFWWAAVAGWPFAFAFAITGRGLGHRVARSWREHRQSPAAELRSRLAAARVACRGGDPRAADAAVARALEAATIAHAGVNVRGAVGEEVVRRLEGGGVRHDAASRIAELLRECETARFSPDEANLAGACGRWERAQAAVRALEGRG